MLTFPCQKFIYMTPLTHISKLASSSSKIYSLSLGIYLGHICLLQRLLANFANFSTYYFRCILLDESLPKKCFMQCLHFENQIKFILIQDFVSCFFISIFPQVIYDIPKSALGCHKNRFGNHCFERITITVMIDTFFHIEAGKDNSHHPGS